MFNKVQHYIKLWPLILPLCLLIPSINAFPYPSADASYSDMSLAHYAYTTYLKRAILEDHVVPFWSPLILSGAPFATNPLAGLWYPPGWLAILIPLPAGFNFLIAFHLLLGGVGMYKLLRAENQGHEAALLGALAFESMPKLFAHYGAGHLTLLYAVPWTPWLLWVARMHTFHTGHRFKWLESVILALIFLADVRWSLYAAITWWAYTLAFRDKSPNSIGHKKIAGSIVHLLKQMSVAFLFVAPLAIPLAEFARLSTRSQMTSEDVMAYSLPVVRLLGLIYPDFGGFHEWITYYGATILMLGMIASLFLLRQSGTLFWVITGCLSLLVSLGSQIPILTPLASFPFFNLLRVPSRALFLMGMALSALSAYAVDRLILGFTDAEKHRIGRLLVGLTGFTLTLTFGVWIISKESPLNFSWGCVMILTGAVWIGLRTFERLSVKLWYTGLICLCLVDWSVMNLSVFAPHSAEQVLAEGEPIAHFLASQTDLFRVYSPSYSLPQQTAAQYSLQLADGVDPMQLRSYASFMEAATGVPSADYSVTIPPFQNGDPKVDNANYVPDPALLGLLNVRYVASEFDLAVEGLQFVSRFGDTRLYENLRVLPRAWIQLQNSTLGHDIKAVESINWRPEKIRIQAEGPGQLVLSEIAYPGWQVSVDGHTSTIEQVNGLLRGVTIGPGEHQVEFDLRPTSVYLGLGLFLLAVLFILTQQWIGRESIRYDAME